MKQKRSFPLILLMILSFEKFIQHMVVTYAFIENLGGIRQSVSLDFRFFMISGFLVGILFLVSFILLIRRNPTSLKLLLYLALFDFFGEFIAQGTLLLPTITVSLLVASLIIIVVLAGRRSLIGNNNHAVQADNNGTHPEGVSSGSHSCGKSRFESRV